MSQTQSADLRKLLDQYDREKAFKLLVKLVAEYGWLAGRSAEDIVQQVRSACYKQELASPKD